MADAVSFDRSPHPLPMPAAPFAQQLSKSRRLQFHRDVHRETPNARLLEFMDAVDGFFFDMQHQHWLQRFSLWRIVKKERYVPFLGRSQSLIRMTDHITLLIACIQNLILITRSQEKKGDGPSNQKFLDATATISTTLGIVQIFACLSVLIIECVQVTYVSLRMRAMNHAKEKLEEVETELADLPPASPDRPQLILQKAKAQAVIDRGGSMWRAPIWFLSMFRSWIRRFEPCHSCRSRKSLESCSVLDR
jgi:hypothetical protein